MAFREVEPPGWRYFRYDRQDHPEEKDRVTNKLRKYVKDFLQKMLDTQDGYYHLSDLRDYVDETIRGRVGPESASRTHRDLRERFGEIDYEVLDAPNSFYQALWVKWGDGEKELTAAEMLAPDFEFPKVDE